MAASSSQKLFYVALEDLKEKYRRNKLRIQSMTKAIGDSTQTQISVQVSPNGTVRFEVVGHRLKKAIKYIVDEFCKVSSAKRLSGEVGLTEGQPIVNLAQEALQLLSEKDQEKLLGEGTHYLLTPEALRKHDILTGALELRQFACADCDHFWWRTVSRTKTVAKCFKCLVKYDALPRDKEFGIGRYRCINCKHSFFSRCEATTERSCRDCGNIVRTPYIHPKFKPIRRRGHLVDPTMTVARVAQRKVVNASQVHDSTGSTASTFITQMEQPQYVPVYVELDDDDIVSVVVSGAESDEEELECQGSTDLESDSGLSYVAHESDIDYSTFDVDSTGGARGSSSDSDSDTDEDKQTKVPDQKVSDEIQSVSSSSSAKDSGLGVEGASSMELKSSDGSTSLQELGSVPRGSIAHFNPTEFPGVTFSKHCAKKVVTDKGGTIEGEGVKLVVPERALKPGDAIAVELQACLSGPFVLPDNITLVSPIYRIAPPCAFHEKVILTIEHFAILERSEDCDDIVFISSPSKPKIKDDEAYWKFHIIAVPECSPRSQRGRVELNHFCLAGLGRRKRRGQRHIYCAYLYSPLSYTPPLCNAIFSVTVYHIVYTENLGRYLQKTFKDQTFLPTSKLFDSTESEIKLQIPTDTPGYKVMTYMGNQIQREGVDYALKYRKQAKSDIITYPPRIVITVRQSDPNSDRSLDCRINVSGIRALPYIELHVSPPSASEVSSQRSISHEDVEECEEELKETDLFDISCYLCDLTNEQCVSLGLAFGLRHSKLKRCTDHPNDVLAAWLRKEDDVGNRCCPTWKNLCNALQRIGQNGIAEKVKIDHLTDL